MIYNAKNGVVKIDDTEMDYIAFGKGDKNLVMIPGLGDGLKTAKGTAVPFSIMYRKLVKDFRVYAFSRRNVIPQGYTTRDMARDVHFAMKQLGIKEAYVVGVSQGGMISQYLAIDYPELVKKLILTVTLARQNEVVRPVIRNWMEMAKRGDYKGIMIDTAENSYSQVYLKKMRPLYSVIGNIGKPKSFDRFLIMGEACLTHNAYEELHKIKCPTLIIGGKEDKILTGEASKEIAEKIEGSSLYMYEGLGHGLYEEAKDFLPRVMEFFR
ncbi:MAG: alpha/beta hydrolase [Lachnospiraceae bacterium]|nr:alpha/beta hydrolase [Lachnospiraceae bacterium]